MIAVALWILWCFLHSFLIATPVTDYLKKRWGRAFRYYRLFYNIVALITFAPLALYSIAIETVPLFRWEGALAILRFGLLAAAAGLFIAGARRYRLSKVVGIYQIRTGNTSHLFSEGDVLSTTGIHGLIRHPWYVAALLLVWARDIGLVGLSTNIVFSLYLIIGAFLEEAKLLKEFGTTYREYQTRVSMMFPWKWLKLIKKTEEVFMRLAGKRIAILVADGVEDLEFYVPCMRLQEEGADVVVAGLELKPVRGKNGLEIIPTARIDALNSADLFAVVVPGGWAPDKLRRYAAVTNLIREMDAAQKVLAFICHGGHVAISAGIVAGRKATGTVAIKDDLANAGAAWVDAPAFREGHLVWGRVVADIPAFCRALVAALTESAARASGV